MVLMQSSLLHWLSPLIVGDKHMLTCQIIYTKFLLSQQSHFLRVQVLFVVCWVTDRIIKPIPDWFLLVLMQNLSLDHLFMDLM
jgi:hypothetical protein